MCTDDIPAFVHHSRRVGGCLLVCKVQCSWQLPEMIDETGGSECAASCVITFAYLPS